MCQHRLFRNYERHTNVYDAAIIILKDPFNLTESVRTACLPDKKLRPMNRSKCIVSGWGKLSEDGPNASSLRHFYQFLKPKYDILI